MAKFIKIKNHLINIEKVVKFDLDYSVIWVYTDDGFDPFEINFNSEREAELVFEDIPHLIDNNYIPAFVREHQLNELKWKAQRAEAKAIMDTSDWDKLPF